MSSELAISARNVSKAYAISSRRLRSTTLGEAMVERLRKPFASRTSETFWALRDVSFEVRRGEVLGIIGRNGAGKSTLLKILSRITSPTTGEIDLYGRVGSLLEVGTGFHPELTGRENIFLNGTILGMSRQEIVRKFDEIVAFSEVEAFLDVPVKRYSSGMYVRLAFAVAAHLEPEILIVDEVLAVGDAEFQRKCIGKMSDVAHEGRTVLFVSHNMDVMQILCPRILLLRSGRIAEAGAAREVISSYMSDASVSVDGCFDLREHPARPAQLKPLIHEVTLLNGDNRPTTVFRPHDRFQAELHIKVPGRVREPRLALAIEDCFGRRITTIASYFNGAPFKDLTGEHKIRCVIPSLNLGTGRYLFSVSVSQKGVGHLDSVDGAGWFDVSWNNSYGNGETYTSAYGPVLSDSEWLEVQ